MTISSRVAKNTFYLLAANLIGHAITFVTALIIWRRLSIGEFGLYNFARSFPLLFLVLADMGMDYIVVREVAVRREGAREYVGKLIPLKAVLTLVCVAAILAAMPFFAHGPHERAATLVLACYAVARTLVNFFMSPVRGYEKMEFVSAALVLESVVAAALIWFTLRPGGGALQVGRLYMISVCVALAFAFFVSARVTGLPRPGVDAALWKATLAASWPLAVSALSVMLNNNVDVVMLKMLKGRPEVALYSSCVVILSVVGYFQNALAVAVFPVISRLFVTDPGALEKSCEKLFKIVSLTGLPFCVGGAAIAGPLLAALSSKPEYAHAANAFIILSAGVAFTGYASFFGIFATGIHRQKSFGLAYLGVTAANVALNFALIPRFGIEGASVATLISNFLLIAWSWFAIMRPYHKFDVAGFLTRLAAALAAMAAALLALKNLHVHVFILIPLGAAVYAAAVLVLKPYTKDDIALLKKALFGREAAG